MNTRNTAPVAANAVKLSPEDINALQAGSGIRIEGPRGIYAEGIVKGTVNDIADRHSRGPGRKVRNVVVGGRTFPVRDPFTLFAVDAAAVTPALSPKITTTPEEVRDIIADLERERGIDAKPVAVGVADLYQTILGFDPSAGLSNSDFGGKSRDGWFAEHLSMSSVKKSLEALIEANRIVKVTASSYNVRRSYSAFVIIHGRSGYVTRAAMDESKAIVDAENRLKEIEKLRLKAIATVAGNHPQEVESELGRLLGEAGL